MSLQETTAFFVHYRDAFDRLDGDAVADTWHVPSGIADSHGEGGTARLTAYIDDGAMRANMHALCNTYRQSGFARADFELRAHTALGANHAFAHVHWTLRRGDGSELQSFGTGYQLARTASGPKVMLAVAYQEDLETLPAAEPRP